MPARHLFWGLAGDGFGLEAWRLQVELAFAVRSLVTESAHVSYMETVHFGHLANEMSNVLLFADE